MTQRKLFVGAITLTLAVGTLFFVSQSSMVSAGHGSFEPQNCATPRYRRNHEKKCRQAQRQTPTPTPSASQSPSTTPNPSASPSVSPTASATPSPAVSPTYSPIGKPVRLTQSNWLGRNLAQTIAEGLVTRSTKIATSSGKSKDNKPVAIESIKTITKNWFCQTRSEVATHKWYNRVADKGINFVDRGDGLEGKNNKLDQNYLISNTFTAGGGENVRWQNFVVVYHKAKSGSVKLSYRISDEGGTTDPADAGWIELADPNDSGSQCAKLKDRRRTDYKLDRVGKYFQYKVHVVKGQVISGLDIEAQPVKQGAAPEPTPSTSVSPSPGSTQDGKITIVTKKLVGSSAPSPSPSGPPLPNLTPTPSSPTPGVSPPSTVNPLCFADQETEPASSVRLSIKQVTGGELEVEDEQTNEDGRWQGLDGEVDEFPVGNYRVTLGDFQREDYKLVAICITPNDGEHHLKTQTSPTDKKATIIVKGGKETKVTVLYAPRTKPYIAMSKFAINAANKILKVVYPGQSLRYLIRYENTGASDAKEVVIRDVIPEQFTVIEQEAVEEGQDVPFVTAPDSQGRTIVTKNVGELKQGQKGSIIIPVILKADAFGSPDEISNLLASPKAGSSPVSQPAGSSAGSGNLNLD